MTLSQYLENCTEVYHTTLDPKGPGCVRIHLVPPAKKKAGIPWAVILNGYSVLPVQTAWAVVLKEFITAVNGTGGKSLDDGDIRELILKTVGNVKKVFPKTDEADIRADLSQMVETLRSVAAGKEPDAKIGYLTLSKYAKYMQAPHRMDLLVSSMDKDGCWNCNQHCIHCYAAGEKMSSVKELTTAEWFGILDKLKAACVPSVTFTGGEPTLRKDLPELVEHGKWFVTRLNTNGILLTKDLCSRLYEASLDSVQVTFYSSDKETHNLLVGGDHFDSTVEGIKNAVAAGLDVSCNTPLCSINRDYVKNLDYLHSLGIHYFSCSGLIPSGNALKEASKMSRLSKEEITSVVKEAYAYCTEHECELSFTSPGWMDEKDLRKMHMVVPSCGACLSNMAVSPDGNVLPCQSWLAEDGLGNLRTQDFKTIWNSKKCKERRMLSAKDEQVCPLREVNAQ